MTKITSNKIKSYSIINFHQKLINMFYIILILISFSTYCIFPIKVFGLEPTSGIVCHELNKKQKTEFLFKRNDDKIFAKVFKRINRNFEYVGNVVGRKISSFILFEDNSINKNLDFAWHLDEVTKSLKPYLLSNKKNELINLPNEQSCISKNFWY